MAQNIIRLTGDDGLVLVGELQAEKNGDGTKTLDELMGGTAGSGKGKGFYQVSAKAPASSVFAWAGAKKYDFFYDNGTLVPAIGDKVLPLPGLDQVAAAIKTWNVNTTFKEYDQTVFEDSETIVRYGKAARDGSMTAVEDINRPFFTSRFMDRMTVSDTGVKTMFRQSNAPFWFIGFKQGQWIPGEKVVAVIGKIMAGSGGAGATAGSNQEFTVNFKPTDGGYFQQIEIAVPAA